MNFLFLTLLVYQYDQSLCRLRMWYLSNFHFNHKYLLNQHHDIQKVLRKLFSPLPWCRFPLPTKHPTSIARLLSWAFHDLEVSLILLLEFQAQIYPYHLQSLDVQHNQWRFFYLKGFRNPTRLGLNSYLWNPWSQQSIQLFGYIYHFRINKMPNTINIQFIQGLYTLCNVHDI